MAQPVYKVYLVKFTPEWYKLTKEEQNAHGAKVAEALKSVGGERVVMCVSAWASENWLGWGVEKLPDMEAAQKYAQLLFDMNHFQYIEANSYLGIEMPAM